jgi:small nuclear ribonucleoprotein (snRNP)-like protein
MILRYMEKRLFIQLNGGRKVTGILRGYDPFMNLVLDDTVEEVSSSEKHNIGMVVSFFLYFVKNNLFILCINIYIVLLGNSR